MKPPLIRHGKAHVEAMRVGDKLDQLNRHRGYLGRRHVDPMTPAGAAWLLWLAQLDELRRELRRRLADALDRFDARQQ
jgi:hypothetical protein